jgi:uncharacterized membrane protein
MEEKPQKFDAVIAYLPVVGWIYAFLSPRRDEFSSFHLRQSIGLFLFLLIVFGSWAIASWALAWIPFGVIIGASLFTLVIGAVVFGVIAWIVGTANAFRGEMHPLPIFGRWAHNLLP